MVGIKNYGGVLFDTATTRLFYSGSNNYPDMIIAPNTNLSGFNGTLYYDTTWFFYNNGILVRDSGFAKYYGANSVINRTPHNRYYKFETNRLLADWWGVIATAGPYERIRTDTVNLASGTNKIDQYKMQLYAGGVAGNHALVQSFTYSNYINPLAALNISGSVFSVLYTPVRNEVLGNNAHKAVLNSNILPYYVDFFSANIPTAFWLGGFQGPFLIAAQYDRFDIVITPWSLRPTYPSQITVGASTALGDRFIYKYFY